MTDIAVRRRYIRKEKIERNYSGSGSGQSNRHWEVFYTSDLESTTLLTGRTVAVVFATPFFGLPVGIHSIKLWRMVNEFGVWVITDVVNHRTSVDWITKDGFSLDIADFEDLSGIHFEYVLTEYEEPEDPEIVEDLVLPE